MFLARATMLLLMSLPGTNQIAHRCVLPVPDDIPEGLSAPNIDGTIVRVLVDSIEVRPRTPNSSQPQMVTVNADTQTFTVHGGWVPHSELAVGQRVRVWFKGCRPPSRKMRPIAAVVELASESAGDDSPE